MQYFKDLFYCTVFLIGAILAHTFSYDKIKRSLIWKPFNRFWIFKLLFSFAFLFIICGSSISNDLFNDSFIGTFILTPIGFILIILLSGNDPIAILLNMAIKVFYIIESIVITIIDYFNGDEHIAEKAAGIAIAIALFDIVEMYKDSTSKYSKEIEAFMGHFRTKKQ